MSERQFTLGPAAGGPRKLWPPALIGAGVLGLAVVAVVLARGPAERSTPTAGFTRIDIVTRPAAATVLRGDRRFGTTPASLEVALDEQIELKIKKPGYATVRETVMATEGGRVLDLDLAPQNGFEGVWMLPDGQLRAFARTGEQVDVFKLEAARGPRTFHRKFVLEDAAAGVQFASTETLVDERLAHEPSCQLVVRVEYHYDPRGDSLAVRSEAVETAIQGRRCLVVKRSLGDPEPLVRADQPVTETRISRAPLGRAFDLPSLRQVGETPIDAWPSTDEVPPSTPPPQQATPPAQAVIRPTPAR